MSESGSATRCFWTASEDATLLRLVSLQPQYHSRDWNSIATSLLGRSNKDCRKRWIKLSKQLNKGPWIEEEDIRLNTAVRQYGSRWTIVSEAVETRSPDQCAKRWKHSLDPKIDRGDWSEQDETRLAQAVETRGRNWVMIAEAEFPRRSPMDLKNKYISYQRKQKQEPSETQAPTKQNDVTMETVSEDVLNSPFDCTWTDQDSMLMEDMVLGASIDPIFRTTEALRHHNYFDSNFNPYLPTNSTPLSSPIPVLSEQPKTPATASSYGSSSVNSKDSPSKGKVALNIEDLDQETASDLIQYLMKKGIQLNIKMQTQS